MNLWLRLLWVLTTARFRGAIGIPQGVSRLTFRVWPHDLDPSIHMNNGRYLTLMDLGRVDVMLRSGLWRALLRNRWTPIAGAITIRYRRELRPLQAFHLDTRLLCWDSALVVMEQTFVIAGGPRDGQLAARALFKGGLYDRKTKSFVPTVRLMEEIGASVTSPEPSAEVEAFLHADEKLKQSVNSG